MTAELAGVDIDELELEIQGRTLILAGVRGAGGREGDVYQQVEIERGPFRRVIELGADVARRRRRRPRYEDGMLRVELPLVAAAGARAARRRRSRAATASDRDRRRLTRRAARGRGGVGASPRELPHEVGVLPLRDTVTFPDMLVPLNVGQERSIELINDVLRGDRSIVMVAEPQPRGRDARARATSTTVGVLGTVARMIRVPDGTLRVLIQGGQRVRIERWVQTEPYLVAEIARAARTSSTRRPS